MPGREEQIADAARRPPVGLRDRLGALHRRPCGRPRRLRRLASARARTRSGASTSGRSATRPPAVSSTSSPTPTWSRSGAPGGRRPARTRARFYELAIEGIAGVGRRDRGLDGGPSQARRRDLPVAGAARDVPGGRQAGRAVLRCARAASTSATGTTRRCDFLRDVGRRASLRSSSGRERSAGAARMSAASVASASATTPTASAACARSCWAASRSRASRACRATPTPTCSRTR